MGKKDMWIAHAELASTPGHSFQGLNELLELFDEFCQQRRRN
jgi:hypothetical protein